jgi:hypothetical protein
VAPYASFAANAESCKVSGVVPPNSAYAAYRGAQHGTPSLITWRALRAAPADARPLALGIEDPALESGTLAVITYLS